jgi:hypothetical protein
MAKAGNKTITWILLRDARALVVEAYQSPSTAERWLQEHLKTGRIRWRLENRWLHRVRPLDE